VVSGWGNNSDGTLGDGGPAAAAHTRPKQVAGLTNVRQVAPGYGHTLALRNDGTVWSWGSNTAGALGRAGSASCRFDVIYYENGTAYLLKVGSDDPTNYNGHKPLPVGATVNIEPKISVNVTSMNPTSANLQLNILP
jgi:alpha-tubulin suppressor-like RCC1 family protein